MLSVKTGHYHPCLEKAFIQEIQTLKKQDPLMHLAVIAPTNWMLDRLQECLTKEKDASFLNISFMNFYVLADNICKYSETEAGHVIRQPVIYECIIAGLLKQYFPDTPIMKNAQSLPFLAKSLFQVLQDLTDASVDYHDLKTAVKEGFVDSIELKKLQSIIHLYGLFQQKLKNLNISHYSDVYRRASARIPHSSFLKSFRHVLAYGFYDLTGVEQDFFREIFRYHSTVFFLPYVKKHPAFSYVTSFFESFVLGLAHDVEEIPSDNRQGFTHLVYPGQHSDELTKEREIFPKAKAIREDIQIINVSGKTDEIWFVAKKILELTDCGVPYDEIGVVARTLDSFRDDIRKIFRENYIPFITSTKEPLDRYPLVKVIRQLLLLKRENFYRPLVIELLNSPYFRLPPSSNTDITPCPDEWDQLSKTLGIHGGIECWLSRLEQQKDLVTSIYENDHDDESPANHKHQIEYMHFILNSVSNDLDSLPETALWSEMVQNIEQLIKKYLHIPAEGIDEEIQKRDLVILDRIFDVLHSFAILDKLDEEVTFDRFIDFFLDACQQDSLSMGLENRKGVRVLDAMSARGVPFRILFILGVNEKVFPRAISEEPFLRDHIRKLLSDVLGNHIPEKLRGFEEEQLLFHFLLNAAREKLYILYERSDLAGKPRVISHYLMDILQQIKTTSCSEENTGDDSSCKVYIPRGIKEKLCNQDLNLLTPKEAGIRMAFDRINPASFFQSIGMDQEVFARSLNALDSIEKHRHHITQYDGFVGDVSGWWNKHAEYGFSPTALETYGICPFKFFMQYVLSLKGTEEPEKAVGVAYDVLGNLYHSILNRFYQHLIVKDYFRKKDKKADITKLLHDISQEVFTGIEQKIPIPYPLLWELKKEEIIAFLTQFISWDLHQLEQSGYVPAFLEKKVKASICSDEPEEVSKANFRGKLDRIDTKEEENRINFRVIDYKSGKIVAGNLAKEAIRGQKLQLPSYIIMAGQLLRDEMKKGNVPEKEPILSDASFVYIAENMEEKKGQTQPPTKGINSEKWHTIMTQYRATIGDFLKNIRDGKFHISTETDAHKCGFCEFATVCRKGHAPLQFRLEKDERLKRYRVIIKQEEKKK